MTHAENISKTSINWEDIITSADLKKIINNP